MLHSSDQTRRALKPDYARKPVFSRVRAGVVVLYVLVIALTLLVPLWISWSEYQSAQKEAEERNLSIARSLSEHLTRSLVSVEQAMQSVAESIDRAGGLDRIDELTLHQQMAARVKSIPQVRAIIVMNSKGQLIAHGLEYPTRHVDLSDRSYFPYHRDNTTARLRIGEPLVSRTDNKWLIPLTLRIQRTDGSFGGIMLSGVEPDYYLSFYDSLKLSQGTRVDIYRQDGVELLSYPLDISLLGTRPGSDDPELASQLEQRDTHSFRKTDGKGREWIVSQITGNIAPIIIRVSSDKALGLAKIRDAALIRTSTSLGVLALVTILFVLMMRQIKRVETYERELRQHRDALQGRVEEQASEIATIFKASPLAIAVVTHNSFDFVNPAFESLFRYATGKALRQPTSVIFAGEEDQFRLNMAMQDSLAKGQTYRSEITLFRRDNTSFWATIFARAIWPEEPQRGVVMMMEDISAQRAATQALKKSERLTRSILDNTADGFALIDSTRKFVDANDAFCRQTGLSREQLLGNTPEAFWKDKAETLFPTHIDPVAPPRYFEISLSPASQNEIHREEHGGLGTEAHFLGTSGTVKDEYGNIDYSFVFLIDNTGQKEIEHGLRQAKTAAETANEAKTAFLARVSHELRTPLHAILSFSDMGIRKIGEGSTDSLHHYFQRIQGSGMRLLSLINDLLDMSRLESHHMIYEMRVQYLRNTLDATLLEIEPRLLAKHLHFNIQNATEGLLLEYDDTRISQVISNLLRNAIRFSPENGQIDIWLIPDAVLGSGKPAAGLCIHNHGPHIPESEMDKIFEVFAQDTGRGNTADTGLGLAISRHILRDHQGELSVKNHPEGGVEFTLLLPAKQRASNKETIAA